MIKKLTILILLSNIICSASQKWTYRDKLGHVEYCCMCYKDFVEEDVIPECFSKNKNNSLRPFCYCANGKLPKCPEFATICNRNVTCLENFVYQECKYSSLSNAKLVCNDSLEWEQNFTCPECPENTTICNKRINCPNRLYHEECQVPFMEATKLVCNESLLWEFNSTCPEENTSWISIGVAVIIIIIFLTVVCIVYWRKKRQTLRSSQVSEIQDSLLRGELPEGNIGNNNRNNIPGRDQENVGEEMQLLNENQGGNARNNNENNIPVQDQGIEGEDRPGNPGDNAGNNNENNIQGQDQENVGEEMQILDENQGGNAGNNNENNIPVQDQGIEGEDRPGNPGDNAGNNNENNIQVTSGIEETGSNSGDEDATIYIRGNPYPDMNLYESGASSLPHNSLSPESLQGLNEMERGYP